MFEKVSRSLKYDSNYFFRPQTYIYIYIYMDTTVDHFTPLALRVRGNNIDCICAAVEAPQSSKSSVFFIVKAFFFLMGCT